jgi:hypothetical protein
MQQAADDQEKPFEIILSGAAWEDIPSQVPATEDFYRDNPDKVEHLKNQYIDLLLANTVHTADTYFHLVI